MNVTDARKIRAGLLALILCALMALTPLMAAAEGGEGEQQPTVDATAETGGSVIVAPEPEDEPDYEPDTATPVKIVSAELNSARDALTVSCEVSESYLAENDGKQLYLFKMSAWSTLVIQSDAKALDDLKLKKTEFSFTCDYSASDAYSPFVVAEQRAGGYAEISVPRYVDPAVQPAEGAGDYPAPATKKGLTSADVGEILLTGAGNTVVTQALDRLLTPTAGSGSIPFIFDGNTYYVSREELDALDARIKPLSENGVRVYLQLTLNGKWRTSEEALGSLYFTEAADGAEGYALNTASKTGVTYYCAVCDFLARRYCAPGGEFGCVDRFIVGLCADTGTKNAAGDMQLSDAVFAYQKQLRLTDAAVRGVDARARVYVPVSHNWNSRAVDSYADYNVKSYLTELASEARRQGDFPYGVALEARASDPASYSVWDDEAAPVDENAPYVTMKNIGVIIDFLDDDAMKYGEERRALAVTDFAVNSNPDSPSDMTPCASYAYAYYRADRSDAVEAIIYSVAADETQRVYPTYQSTADGSGSDAEPADGESAADVRALYLGLSYADGTHKQIYDVFRKIDAAVITDVNYKEGDSASFALPIIGITSWADVVPGFQKEEVARYSLAEAMPVLASDMPSSAAYNYVGTFNEGSFDGFYPAGARFVELRTVENASGKLSPVLYAGFANDGGRARSGVTCMLAQPASDAGYVTFDVLVEAPVEVASAHVEVYVGAYGSEDGSSARFIGAATVKPNTWEQVTFKIEDLSSVCDRVDSLSIFVSSYDGLNHAGKWGVTLDNVALCGGSSRSVGSVVKTVFIVLIVLFLLVVVAVMALRAYNSHKAKKRRAARRADLDARDH